MKKLNATNAIAILSLGLTLSVVVAGCGGNDSAESAVTKNAKAGSSDGGAGGGTTKPDTKTGSSDSGAGGGATTSDTKTGSADGGTGKSATVSAKDLMKFFGEDYSDLTPAQINSITSEQWSSYVDSGLFSASQVAAFPTKIIKNLSAAKLMDLSTEATQALTTEQLNSMSKDQLNALISPSDGSAMELTDAQLDFVNARLITLG